MRRGRAPSPTDPWDVPLEAKVDLLLKANAEALKAPKVKYVNSVLFFVKQDRNYANTDGSVINQTLIRSWPLSSRQPPSPMTSSISKTVRRLIVAPMGRDGNTRRNLILIGNAHG